MFFPNVINILSLALNQQHLFAKGIIDCCLHLLLGTVEKL